MKFEDSEQTKTFILIGLFALLAIGGLIVAFG